MTATAPRGLEEFRRFAREWIHDNLAPIGTASLSLRNDKSDDEELAGVTHDRELQRRFYEAGLAGICFPIEYGGQDLMPAHQRVLNEELVGFEFPMRLQAPTFTPCAAVLLDFGTEDQKRRHIPAILKGEEIWMQLLSEPSGGSDVAGALTSAVRDADEWVLNGSKIWTTGAWWSDWGLCLARTNWDVPKHRGLTVFMLPIRSAGVELHRIEMLNGNREFCQEYLSDVRVPDSYRLGEIDGGWTVGTRWMFHERMLYGSPYATIPIGTHRGATGERRVLSVARDAGRLHDPAVRELVGEDRTLDLVNDAVQRRIADNIAHGTMSDQAAAVARLFSGFSHARRVSIAFTVAGGLGAAWDEDDGEAAETGVDILMRQTTSIGGGTTEMARNVISERVLGMPRERASDRDIPFRDVPRGSTATRPSS